MLRGARTTGSEVTRGLGELSAGALIVTAGAPVGGTRGSGCVPHADQASRLTWETSIDAARPAANPRRLRDRGSNRGPWPDGGVLKPAGGVLARPAVAQVGCRRPAA